MSVRIQITYLTEGGKAQQSGTFPLRGIKPRDVAFEWLLQIKRKVTYKELISVIVDGKEDITEEVNKLLKPPFDE